MCAKSWMTICDFRSQTDPPDCSMATTAVEYKAAETFDSVGPAYEDAFAGHTEQAASIDWLLSTLTTKPARILDIGCGTGRPVCSRLADAGHSVLGIDISGAMLEAARERVPKAEFQQLDYRDFKAEPASFDAITIYFSMIAGVTQDDIKEAFKQVYSWLKPGGLFVFATVAIDANNVEVKWMGRPVTVSSLAPEAAVAAIKDAKFEVVRENVSTFTPKAAEVGICSKDDVWEELHLFVYAKKA